MVADVHSSASSLLSLAVKREELYLAKKLYRFTHNKAKNL